MNIFYKVFCRVYQKVMYLLAFLLPWRQPLKFTLEVTFVNKMLARGHRRMLLVADKGLTTLGLYNSLLSIMRDSGIEVVVFDDVVPNPTVQNIEQGLAMYYDSGATAVVAFGGGSPMDCAKGICARVACPRKSLQRMRGLLKVGRAIPDIFAVPTTAGTGSETTLVAVVTDQDSQQKYAISDPCLVPPYVLLDAKSTVALPDDITATTGMDALCHAVEAYIGNSNTKHTKKYAIKAIRLISDNLLEAYNNPTNLRARKNMLHASYLAGVAFTRAYVGNVHAMSHALSAKYHIAHGLANAVLLPVVMRYYGKHAHAKLAMLAQAIGYEGATDEQKADKLIAWIDDINSKMNIPHNLPQIQEADIDALARHAYQEANPLYPVPVILSKKQFAYIYRQLL